MRDSCVHETLSVRQKRWSVELSVTKGPFAPGVTKDEGEVFCDNKCFCVHTNQFAYNLNLRGCRGGHGVNIVLAEKLCSDPRELWPCQALLFNDSIYIK